MRSERSMTYVHHVLEPTYNFTKEHFYRYIMEINMAHVYMLYRQNIIKKDCASSVLKSSLKLYQQGFTKEYDPQFEDLFFMIENAIEADIGEEQTGNMHIAFSRNDMDATMFRMHWRERLVSWLDKLNMVRQTLLEVAEQHKQTVMPAYTHNQQAQPTTLAHYLLAVENNLKRDVERGLELYKRINQSPMGAAALGTTGFYIDRQMMGDWLGFERIIENSYDAISASDYMVEVAGVMNTSLTTLSRFVYDLMFLATNEVNVLRLGDIHVQTSSIMPQKRNPSALEHTRALISKALGALNGVPYMAHSVPYGDIVDIGDDVQPVLQEGVECTITVYEMIDEVISKATFDKELLYARAQLGFSTVTEIADHLVRNFDIPFRQAHAIVHRFVQELVKNKQTLRDAKVHQFNEVATELGFEHVQMQDSEFAEVVDVYSFINKRSVIGGPAETEIKRQMEQADLKLAEDQNTVDQIDQNIQSYYAKLIKEIEQFLFQSEPTS